MTEETFINEFDELQQVLYRTPRCVIEKSHDFDEKLSCGIFQAENCFTVYEESGRVPLFRLEEESSTKQRFLLLPSCRSQKLSLKFRSMPAWTASKRSTYLPAYLTAFPPYLTYVLAQQNRELPKVAAEALVC